MSSYLAAGSVRRFAFDLRRGQYAALQVTQESLDVALTVHPPDGRRWAPLDTQTVLPVPEVLWLVAASDGRYALDVAAAGRVRAGPFHLEVTELRPATTRDQVAVDAQNRLAEAEELRRHNDEASDVGSLPIYEEAVRLFGRAREAGGEGYARLQWARVLARRGRRLEAAASLRRCLGLPVLTQRPGTRARAASLLAEQLSDLGESAAADAADLEALGQWQQLQRPDWQAIVINDMAHRAAERGELAKAEGLYLRALRLFEHHGGASDAAVALGNLASVYNLAGEPQLALDAAEQGIARFPQNASPSRMAEVLAQEGEALAKLDRREAAQTALAKALELLEKGAPAERAQLERRLARRAYDRGDFDEAAQRFRSALTALEAAQDRSSAVATRQDLAWTELKRGHLGAAERLFQSIPIQGGPLQNHWIEPAALAGRARLERARGHLDLALGFARRALDGVELLRREVGRTDLKTSVFAGQQSYFDLTLDLLFELFDRTGDRSLVVEAFEVSERSRARRLLDLLVSGRSLSPAPNPAVDDFAVNRLSQAEERLGVLRAAGAEPSVVALAERQVREAVVDLRREQGLASTAPGLEETPLSLLQIQRWLDPDTVLLEFHLGEDASYLWVVSRRQLVVHRLPRQEVIENVARRALGVLSSQGIAAETVQGRQTLLAASRLLVGAAMPELASRRWLFSMDGVLHALPLGALPNPTNPGEPIIATHEVAYSPSASVAVRLAARAGHLERKPRREVAMFADPVYEPASSAPLERAARQVEPPRETSSALRSPGNSLLRLPRLRYAGDEARRILALAAPAARLEALRYAATKARVLSGELADYRHLHFAVHGLPDENHPELSAVALSTFDARGKPQDGILFAHEIARLRLPADLVVLSACQSGRGAAISGEGLVGLVQAFFTAGSARVVASEWAVNDQATAVLMGLFYEGLLGRHLDPARALEEAQLALARERSWRRPYFWAGFVVEGGF
ncbi:MAG TPA: CHAT domain-containing protein [Thermoanaerobaculia bacterium]|nr:CHAT domain-containing protein [Thermoanaerobaculia bacterium]